jgi:MFS family permease
MLLEVGAAKSEDEVGYAAGVVESVFSVAQLLTVFHWGSLSDRIGRKPVLILVSWLTLARSHLSKADAQGCIGSSISAVAFGFSNSFWTLVITRSLNGMMNGNVAVLKSVM